MEGDPAGIALPVDAMAEILRRLPPRSIAASRCVCKAWRAVIDARQLLRSELLPHSVRGIFFMCHDLGNPAFLAHPSIDPEIFGKLDFHLCTDRLSYATIVGHCNGLVLYKDPRGFHVANPATQRRALLPPLPRKGLSCYDAHLVFDPAVSLHYEVLLVPQSPHIETRYMEERQQERDEEWPASTWVMCVFSSRTGQWEEKAFVREGEAAGMASDEVMRRSDPIWYARSAYWHGALYVQCLGGFIVMRITLSNSKYQVLKMPIGIGKLEYYDVCLGRSKEGLCCASFRDWYNLRVWILDDSDGTIDWMLKYDIDMEFIVKRVMTHCEENEGPWNLQDANICELCDEDDSNNAPVKSTVEWDSDNDNIVDNQSEVGLYVQGLNTVLGFHPYKDIVFLDLSLQRAAAYHLNTSIVQDLGKICPKDYISHVQSITLSFPYTPCLMPEFPENC